MILAISRLETPSARRARMSKSSVTDGSPASILATRDWLDFTSRASSCCVSCRRRLRVRRLCANLTLSSTYALSSGDSDRNSAAEPKRQPLVSRRFLLALRIVITPQSLPASRYDLCRRSSRFLAEHLKDNNGIRVDSIYHSPGSSRVVDPKFMAPSTDGRHRSRMRQP